MVGVLIYLVSERVKSLAEMVSPADDYYVRLEEK